MQPAPRLALLLVVGLAPAACAAPYRVHHLRQADHLAGPRILCMVAHPDDEIAFAGTVYKASTLLDGACDVLVVTNGEGGFKFATLSERIYGLELTDEEVGRAHLPAIRERELLAGCELLGVRDVYLVGQKDHRYTQDPLEILGPEADVWDVELVRAVLDEVLRRGGYDFVFTLAPTASTHGHHQAATILAIEAASRLPAERRPAILCVQLEDEDQPKAAPEPLDAFPITRLRAAGPFVFDRTQAFGHGDRLTYRIVANWAIAEHKSQGTMQLLMNTGDRELYFLFDASPPDADEKARELFSALRAPQFPARAYEESAGTNADL